MGMKVFLEREKKWVDVQATSMRDVVKALNLNPTTVLLVKNQKLVTEDTLVTEADEVKILSVISGG